MTETESTPPCPRKPRVWNKRESNIPEDAVYVGRPTLLGNPFSHLGLSMAKHKVATRQDAIDRFKSYALKRLRIDPGFKSAIAGLYGKDLVCWCYPLPCHADVLIELTNMIHKGEL